MRQFPAFTVAGCPRPSLGGHELRVSYIGTLCFAFNPWSVSGSSSCLFSPFILLFAFGLPISVVLYWYVMLFCDMGRPPLFVLLETKYSRDSDVLLLVYNSNVIHRKKNYTAVRKNSYYNSKINK